MANLQNNPTHRSKSTGCRTARSTSLFDFQSIKNQFLPSPSGFYSPYILPQWPPMNYMYMDYMRQLSLERELQTGFPNGKASYDWGNHDRNKSAQCKKRHRAKEHRRVYSAMGRAPCRPQYCQLEYEPPRYRSNHFNQPCIEDSSSSSESLLPCNSCRCCKYFSESCSVLDVLCRSQCGRQCFKSQDYSQCHKCQHQYNCHPNNIPPEIPVRETPKVSRRKKNKNGLKESPSLPQHDSEDSEERDSSNRMKQNVKGKTVKEHRTDKSKSKNKGSDTESSEKSYAEPEVNHRYIYGGTGDERTVKSQTKMSVKKKPRPKSTAYFLPMSFLN